MQPRRDLAALFVRDPATAGLPRWDVDTTGQVVLLQQSQRQVWSQVYPRVRQDRHPRYLGPQRALLLRL